MTTKIDWLYDPDNVTRGRTINPTPGCNMKNCAIGVNCYAFNGSVRQKHRCIECYCFRPHFHAERFMTMSLRTIPTGYFFSTGEFFDEEFTDEDIQHRLDYLGNSCRQHRIYILTKQAHRLPDFDFPSNIWVGVSVNVEKDIWRVDKLRECNAVIKFLSCEPLYENIADNFGFNLREIDQIIIGAETKRGKVTFKPASNWVWGLIDQARANGSSVFLKNNLQFEKNIQEIPKQKLEAIPV